jgi:hypothetical protein
MKRDASKQLESAAAAEECKYSRELLPVAGKL